MSTRVNRGNISADWSLFLNTGVSALFVIFITVETLFITVHPDECPHCRGCRGFPAGERPFIGYPASRAGSALRPGVFLYLVHLPTEPLAVP